MFFFHCFYRSLRSALFQISTFRKNIDPMSTMLQVAMKLCECVIFLYLHIPLSRSLSLAICRHLSLGMDTVCVTTGFILHLCVMQYTALKWRNSLCGAITLTNSPHFESIEHNWIGMDYRVNPII